MVMVDSTVSDPVNLPNSSNYIIKHIISLSILFLYRVLTSKVLFIVTATQLAKALLMPICNFQIYLAYTGLIREYDRGCPSEIV